MKNKNRQKRKLSFQHFNRMLNQLFNELGLKKEKQLEEQHYLQLLTENLNQQFQGEDFSVRVKRQLN